MKNIILAAVVISTLTVAGIGGTFAGFSDTEMSEDNFFEVGSLDLRVSVGGTTEYEDPNVPPIAQATVNWPCTSQDFLWDIHSVSEPAGKMAYAYIKFKNYEYSEVETLKHPDGRPEPEEVAENGGTLNQVEIEGLGPVGVTDGENDLDDFVEVVIEFDSDGDGYLDTTWGNPIWGGPGTIYLSDLDEDEGWLALGQIPACEVRVGKLSLHVSDWPEAAFEENYFADDLPFDHWPTNALMLDRIDFDIEFALTQEPIPAGYLNGVSAFIAP